MSTRINGTHYRRSPSAADPGSSQKGTGDAILPSDILTHAKEEVTLQFCETVESQKPRAAAARKNHSAKRRNPVRPA